MTLIKAFGPTEIAIEHTSRYVEAFNSGDADRVNALYTDEAVSVWEAGQALTGQARKDQLTAFLAQKPIMSAAVREAFATDDTVLQVVDWTIDVSDEYGNVERLTGVGLDVLVRQEDGQWRYAVDNPHGA
jgi:uncharacterized protein (TIGR02246 family)